jgi:serine/threonine protein kinase
LLSAARLIKLKSNKEYFIKMDKIPGYLLLEKISETRNSIVYRGQKENEKQTVIIKILKAFLPSPSDTARFKREYNLVKALDMEGIVKVLDLVPCNSSYAIIQEDFSGISLKALLKSSPPDLAFFLRISIKLAEILGILHWNHIIHMDIKPENIIINQKEEKVKITDFGISTVLTHANDEISNPEVIEGTFYMSPNRKNEPQYRLQDRLYSLGITFYKMLTGKVPFNADDPMEIIHSHIARQPEPVHEVNPAVPRVISHIVLKLLAKTPEERYQNSMGLMADLVECSDRLNRDNRIDDFPLGTKDISLRFNIPQIIIGREKEIRELTAAYKQAAGGTGGIMLVLGEPGIGKSALVNEIHKLIAAGRGYSHFARDQFRKMYRKAPDPASRL